MARGSTRFYAVAALVVLIAGLVLASLLQPVFGTRTDFSMYNTRWNGASDLAGHLYGTGDLVPAFSFDFSDEETQPAHRSLTSYDLSPEDHTVLALAPTKNLTQEEADWLASFVARGGRLVVADDFGSGNAFLRAVGAETRIEGRLVADLVYSKQAPFVVVTDVHQHPATGGARELLLDHGATLEPGPNATVLAATGSSAWLEANLNLVQDPGEPTGPFEFAALEPVGNGSVLVVGDPSIYINGMQDEADNGKATRGLVAWSTAGGRDVLVDEAHRDYPDPVRLAGANLGSLDSTVTWVLGGLAFGVFLAFALGRPETWFRAAVRRARRLLERVFPRPPEEEPDPLDVVQQRHPDWNETTLREVEEAWNEEHGDR